MQVSDLPPLPPPDPSLPEWVRTEVTNAQAWTDKEYVDQVNNFLNQSKNWLDTQIYIRGSNPNYQVPPEQQFKTEIPRRKYVTADENGFIKLSPLMADFNLKLPVLPPYVTPTPVNPPGTGPFGPPGGLPAPGDTNRTVIQILALVKQIAERMGIPVGS